VFVDHQVLHDIKRVALKRAGLTEEDVIARVQERADARAAKDWERSDQIRKDLAALGISLMDGGDATQWRPAPADDQDS
jgi:cysteinyl-tRNA synthetase